MSTFEISETPFDIKTGPVKKEKLRLGPSSIEGILHVYSGQQGDHMVSIIPSLNVSGYGNTERDAFESLKENLHTLFEDLFSVNDVLRRSELRSLGWVNDNIFKRRLSRSFVDENGVLQHFDHPDQVKKSILTAA